MKTTIYRNTGPREDAVITTVKVERGPAHDRASVWNRSGLSGVLIVNHGDGDWLAKRLIPQDIREVEEYDD